VAVVPAVVRAGFVLTRFSSPVRVTQASAIDAASLSLANVAVLWAYVVAAVRAGVEGKAFDGAVVEDQAVSRDNVAGGTTGTFETTITFASDLVGLLIRKQALSVSIAGGMGLADGGVAVRITPSLGTKASSVEAAAAARFGHAVFGAIDKAAVFPAETSIAHTGAISIAGTVTGAVVRAHLKAAVAVGESSITRAHASSAALSVVATHVRAGLHGAVESTKSFGTLADAIGTLSTATAVVRAGFYGAVGANEWVFADALEVRAGAVATAVFRADHRLARNTLPSLAADAGSVVTVAMFGARVGTETDGAVSTSPAWVTETLVGFFGTADTVAGAVVFADHHRAVGALPAGEALAAALIAHAVASADVTVFHGAGRNVACLACPVTVTRALTRIFAFSLLGAVLGAPREGAVDTSPGWVARAVSLAARSVVAAVFRARALAAVFPGETSVAVARSVEALALHGAAVQARSHGAVVGGPAVLALALPAHAVAVAAAVIRARFVYLGNR